MDRLSEIEERLAAATRGPWTWDTHRVPTLSGRAGDPETYEYDTEVIEADHHGECGCRSACVLDLNVLPADAELIAHAPADLAALVAVVREVAALHTPGPESGDGVVCFECAPKRWPCPTAAAVQKLGEGS